VGKKAGFNSAPRISEEPAEQQKKTLAQPSETTHVEPLVKKKKFPPSLSLVQPPHVEPLVKKKDNSQAIEKEQPFVY